MNMTFPYCSLVDHKVSFVILQVPNSHNRHELIGSNPHSSLPFNSESIADAETDGVTYCSFENKDPACTRRLEDGFIRAAAVTHSDDGAWIQV